MIVDVYRSGYVFIFVRESDYVSTFYFNVGEGVLFVVKSIECDFIKIFLLRKCLNVKLKFLGWCTFLKKDYYL